ncbi:hypothetical protein VME0621_05098 [Vibrio mediterranei]|uniref:STAS/SEC14 domain-containing protein n=1 Tax=Vibrio mediterranei TaxID=689 RepID=UPI0007846919|nr:STAS/SEC14 domain-containing protein [Vibrio mediterranei]SBO12927.1 hypothetical protein VME0621_05098 [Vibrio mediterranei]
MLNVKLDESEGIAILQPDGELSEKDFSSVAQIIDPYIENNGELKGLIIHVKIFPGWDSFSSLLGHIKFVKEHHKHISKLALSTDSSMAVIADHVTNHFVSAEVKSFPFDGIEAAKEWILGR